MMELVWLILAAVFIVAEIISLGLTSIWFAGGAFVSAVLAYFNAPLWLQIVVFAAVSIALLIATKPFVKKHLMKKMEKTNVDSYIGRKVLVISEIDNNKNCGQVKMNDVEWTARSVTGCVIPEGSMVIIKEISGVKLMVDFPGFDENVTNIND